MGMYDNLRCLAPLPGDVPDANARTYQTKDTPQQFCGLYEIREDGTLWVEEYDVEDRSDHSAKGFARLIGIMTPVNKRWVQLEDFTDSVTFYDFYSPLKNSGLVVFKAIFIEGRLAHVALELCDKGDISQSDERRNGPVDTSVLSG